MKSPEGLENRAGVPVRYESPSIVRREQLKALLLDGAKSDLPADTNVSDVNVKDNIVPVRW